MIDKIQKIREEVEKLMYGFNLEADIASCEDAETEKLADIKCQVCKKLLDYIDSMQEEPVSDGLEEAAFGYAEACKYDGGEKLLCVEHFKAGAKWGKNQAMAEIQAQSMALAHGCPEESVSKDLGEYINELSKQFPDVSFAKLSRISIRVAKWQKEKEYSCYEEAFEDGAQWQKQKTIDKACKWIEERAAKYLVDRFVGSTRVVGLDNSIIDDFKKDMED